MHAYTYLKGHLCNSHGLVTRLPLPCSPVSSNGTDMRCRTYSRICAVQEYAEYAAYRRQ